MAAKEGTSSPEKLRSEVDKSRSDAKHIEELEELKKNLTEENVQLKKRVQELTAANKKGAKVLVLFYSTYGHNYAMAKAAAEGAKAAGGSVDIKRVPETLPKEVLEKMHAVEAQKAFESVPVAEVSQLVDYDAIIFLIPTRFGSIPAQMSAFLDATGQLWMEGKLVGKVGSVMVSSASQHGGQETTIKAMHTSLLHHGMVLVGLPYAFQGQMGVEEVKGGSPYGATTIAGGDGSRQPSEVELEGAKFQGQHVATIAGKLVAE